MREIDRWGRWESLCAGILVGLAFFVGCDDSLQPKPPKQQNMPPETLLAVQGDSLPVLFYKFPMAWLGSDADGTVTGYRYRWTCPPGTMDCAVDTAWVETAETDIEFTMPVIDRAGYTLEVAAIDDDGAADPTPARQDFEFYNTAPVAFFQRGTLPSKSLPAITFYLGAVDPDTTIVEDDDDSRANLSHYEVWLDGSATVKTVPIEDNTVTMRVGDFEERYGNRTIFLQAFDDGGAGSDVVEHTWEVESAPANGILLVDDCRMGGFLATRSDQSYTNVLEAEAPGRYRVMQIASLPRLSRDDLEATIELFDRVVWYTDADTLSSGALELARQALLDLLENRQGRLHISSALVFGTRSAFGDDEPRFRELFGIDEVFVAPNGGTNWAIALQDTVQAAVQPGLSFFRFLSLGLRPVMDCLAAAPGGDAQSVYYYPPGEFVRGGFINDTQFDIGVVNSAEGGARTSIVTFPMGLPINTNMGENEVEIRELLRLVGILDP